MNNKSNDPADLFAHLYEELRKLAAAKLAREGPGHTLQPTALVHEAWLRLTANDPRAQFENSAHFFGAAAEAMRRILVESARRKRTVRHGGEYERVDPADTELIAPAASEEVLAVHEALEKYAKVDPVKARLVELRYFGGLNFAEAAAILGVAEPTAKGYWPFARAWLKREIQKNGGGPQ